MTEPVCPQCQATLDTDLIDSTGVAECPFCGEDLSDVDFGSDVDSDPSPNGADDSSPVSSASSPNSVGTESGNVSLPATSKIQIIDTDSSRMVIYIPSGGTKARAIGFFALFWNGFMTFFTTTIFAGAGPDEMGLWPMVSFLSLFWAIGLGMLYVWLRMRFTRLYLMFEQNRLVVQRILFGRKSIRETVLGPESAASLVEAYQQNEVPVYSVAVPGAQRTAKFGTSLSLEEKRWFVRTINDFLGHRGKPIDELLLRCDACGTAIDPELLATAEKTVVCPSCAQEINTQQLSLGAVHQEDVQISDLDPRDLSAESQIHIEENSPQRLALNCPAVPSGGPRGFIVGFLVLFSLAFSGGSLSALVVGFKGFQDPMDLLFVIVPGLFVLAGSLPLLIALFLLRGRMTIDLSPGSFSCRWHLGPLGYRKSFPTESITRVAVTAGLSGKRQLAGQSELASSNNSTRVCMIWSGGKAIPLTAFQDAAFARVMAGLLRFQLHRMGFELSDD